MPACSPHSKILLTGACGFLGSHMATTLGKTFHVRSLDLENRTGADDFIAGSVADPTTLERAFEGVEALVIAHMAPNKPGIYDTPELPFDVNVKGTAHLFHMAAQKGIRRVVLISSAGVVSAAVEGGKNGGYFSRDLPLFPAKNMYGLTKLLQETTAQYYHKHFALEIAVLRPFLICCGDTLEDKYGNRRPSVNWQFIDAGDIGKAASAALTVENLGYEVFYLAAGPDASLHVDVAHTESFLGWQPDHRFTEFPRDEELAKKS